MDWAAQFGNWGKVGVESIIDKCVSVGITRIYWRAFGGGLAMYQSQFEFFFNRRHTSRWSQMLDVLQVAFRADAQLLAGVAGAECAAVCPVAG